MTPVSDSRATLLARMTPLGFGGAEIGNLFEPMPDEQAEAAVATALEGGISHFDTAPFYGFGLSGKRLGRALATHARSADVVLSTKVGRRPQAPASKRPDTHQSGEYLDLAGKRRLLEAGACDVINVHGHVSDVMRAGWLAAYANVEVAFGNTFLEVGVNMALALPGVRWLEYSFRNFAHLVEKPFAIRDGLIYGNDMPGHGLVLSSAARSSHRCPIPLGDDALGPAPVCSYDSPGSM